MIEFIGIVVAAVSYVFGYYKGRYDGACKVSEIKRSEGKNFKSSFSKIV